VTVHHRSASVADALSTALYAAAPDEIAPTLAGPPLRIRQQPSFAAAHRCLNCYFFLPAASNWLR